MRRGSAGGLPDLNAPVAQRTGHRPPEPEQREFESPQAHWKMVLRAEPESSCAQGEKIRGGSPLQWDAEPWITDVPE